MWNILLYINYEFLIKLIYWKTRHNDVWVYLLYGKIEIKKEVYFFKNLKKR